MAKARPNNSTMLSINPAWIALIEILRRIEAQPYHWPTGRTIFQKMAYVATREGLPTELVYQKGSPGPSFEYDNNELLAGAFLRLNVFPDPKHVMLAADD